MKFKWYALLYVECFAVISLLMNPLKRHKLATAFKQLTSNGLFVFIEAK